ncbi:molybdopterin-guanine dinucleotide biosynthesis protein B, partial [Candidatus Pacearchaeota archaeon]|nr:molybdopterin-guanine dinucleotide biosynthesis protein B [Candidatus Pacearchaeota archaeon]
MSHEHQTLILGFVAYSGTGKTTLLEKLIPLLTAKGLRVGLIKHCHHDFDIDIPGKDSYRLRKAGAQQVMVASAKRWALITEQPEVQPEPVLHELLHQMEQDQLNIILVEGFKHESFPKIELHRQALAKPFLFTNDDTIIA